MGLELGMRLEGFPSRAEIERMREREAEPCAIASTRASSAARRRTACDVPQHGDVAARPRADRDDPRQGQGGAPARRPHDHARQARRPARAPPGAAVVRGREVTAKLFDELAERFARRTGGYTRVLQTRRRVGRRRGDLDRRRWSSRPPRRPKPAAEKGAEAEAGRKKAAAAKKAAKARRPRRRRSPRRRRAGHARRPTAQEGLAQEEVLRQGGLALVRTARGCSRRSSAAAVGFALWTGSSVPARSAAAAARPTSRCPSARTRRAVARALRGRGRAAELLGDLVQAVRGRDARDAAPVRGARPRGPRAPRGLGRRRRATWSRFRERLGLTFPILWDPEQARRGRLPGLSLPGDAPDRPRRRRRRALHRPARVGRAALRGAASGGCSREATRRRSTAERRGLVDFARLLACAARPRVRGVRSTRMRLGAVPDWRSRATFGSLGEGRAMVRVARDRLSPSRGALLAFIDRDSGLRTWSRCATSWPWRRRASSGCAASVAGSSATAAGSGRDDPFALERAIRERLGLRARPARRSCAWTAPGDANPRIP